MALLRTVSVIGFVLSLAVAGYAQYPQYGAYPQYGSYSPHPGAVPGTYGNDTAGTLYLRPLNNAMLGPAYFGTGYPVVYMPYYGTPYQNPGGSGIIRAQDYLEQSGWNVWMQERRELLAEREVLLRRIDSLEKRLERIESRLNNERK